jgi:hypothetical protein
MPILLTTEQSDAVLNKLVALAGAQKRLKVLMHEVSYRPNDAVNFQAFFYEPKNRKGLWKFLGKNNQSGLRVQGQAIVTKGRINDDATFSCDLHLLEGGFVSEQINLADPDKLRAFVLPFFAEALNARSEQFLSKVIA